MGTSRKNSGADLGVYRPNLEVIGIDHICHKA